MIRTYYEKICAGEQVREQLIALKEALKEENNCRALAYLLGGDFEVFCRLLEHEDPKVRKNAALILGKMKSEDLLPILFHAYEKEQTLFIRADYLKAMEELNYQPYQAQLEQKLEELRTAKRQPEEEKHWASELHMLQKMVMKYRRIRRHTFIGEDTRRELLLVTNRCQREVTARQLPGEQVTLLGGGIRVRNCTVGAVLPIRTWSELLFPISCETLPAEKPERIGTLLGEPVLGMLRELHEGRDPFLYRIELRGRMTPEKKGIYIKRISSGLERACQGMLINSVSDYEVEIRLLERKDGTFVPMLKLFSIPEKRFAYRGESVASSIAPVNAALVAELARPYLRENAQVLDPFCGVGTMLIERNYAVHAGTMYGIDILGEAIEKARLNTSHAGMRIFYINKDFFTFSHEYRFDEVITDMPQVTASRSKQEIRSLYLQFFGAVGECLNPDAVLVLYATEPQFAREAVQRYPEYRIVQSNMVNEKNGTEVLVIRRK
jgi:hypothetical protein